METKTQNNYTYFTSTSTSNNTLWGLKDEKQAIKWVEENYPLWTVKEADRDEQRQHIDYSFTTEQGIKYNVDIKSTKHFKTKRGEEFCKDDYNTISLELVGDYGFDGWLFGFKTVKNHYIHFITKIEDDYSYVFVSSYSLYFGLKSKIEEAQEKGLLYYNPHDYYIIHTRKNVMSEKNSYKCRIVEVPLSDVLSLTNCKIIKPYLYL